MDPHRPNLEAAGRFLREYVVSRRALAMQLAAAAAAQQPQQPQQGEGQQVRFLWGLRTASTHPRGMKAAGTLCSWRLQPLHSSHSGARDSRYASMQDSTQRPSCTFRPTHLLFPQCAPHSPLTLALVPPPLLPPPPCLPQAMQQPEYVLPYLTYLLAHHPDLPP